jgi:type I restriction enzyme S subunit
MNKSYKLREILTVLTDYHANGAYKKLKENVELKDEPDFSVMIRTTNFEQDNFNDFKYVDQHAYEFLAKSKVYPDDILMNKIANAGSSYLMPDIGKPVSLAMNLFLLRVNEKLADPCYVYLWLKVNEKYVKGFANGTTTKTITKDSVNNLNVSLPELDSQKLIASKYRTYQKAIKNNKRRIAILEDMAQSLYREWFVKFRYPGHAEVLDASSPNTLIESKDKPKLIDSSLGQIPEGWEVKSAAEAITINPKTKLMKDGDKPFVGMSGLSQCSMVIGDIIQKTGNSGAKFINGDTLFARITPCLQNGKTGYVQFLTPEQPVGFGSTEFIVLRESDDLSSEYIYLLSRSNNFREHAIQSMTGATGRQRVHNDCFASCYLPVPPKELMNEFTKLVKPMFKSIFNLSKRNENLKQQRDMLLPKFISGQIELKD